MSVCLSSWTPDWNQDTSPLSLQHVFNSFTSVFCFTSLFLPLSYSLFSPHRFSLPFHLLSKMAAGLRNTANQTLLVSQQISLKTCETMQKTLNLPHLYCLCNLSVQLVFCKVRFCVLRTETVVSKSAERFLSPQQPRSHDHHSALKLSLGKTVQL